MCRDSTLMMVILFQLMGQYLMDDAPVKESGTLCLDKTIGYVICDKTIN